MRIVISLIITIVLTMSASAQTFHAMIFSNMKESGELNQPKNDLWGDRDDYCNELIHIYCMSPILEAAKILNRPDYEEKANKVLDYNIKNYRDRIINFTLFSHFYAYVIEGLIDCGRIKIAKEAMRNFEKYRRKALATKLYKLIETEMNMLAIQLIYTHVDAENKVSLVFHYKQGFMDEIYQLVKQNK